MVGPRPRGETESGDSSLSVDDRKAQIKINIVWQAGQLIQDTGEMCIRYIQTHTGDNPKKYDEIRRENEYYT